MIYGVISARTSDGVGAECPSEESVFLIVVACLLRAFCFFCSSNFHHSIFHTNTISFFYNILTSYIYIKVPKFSSKELLNPPLFNAMMSRHHRTEQYELLPRTSQDSNVSSSSSFKDHDGPPPSNPKLFKRMIWHFFRFPFRPVRSIYSRVHRQGGSRGLFFRGSCWIFTALVAFTAVLVMLTFAFRPSYTYLPDHYQALQKRCVESKEPGRGNINNERIFIAAALHDPGGTLVGKDWGSEVLQLVEMLGPQYVHLSIYENDADSRAKAALESMQNKITC